jgi:hypothetical protein
MEEIDLSKEIEKILLNSNRSKEIKSGEEVNKLSKKKFLGVHTHEFGLQNKVFEGIAIENVLMGFSLSGGCVVFSKNKFCISNGMINKYRLFPISQFRKLSIERDGLTSDSVFLNGKRVGNFNRQSIDPWKRICDEINLFLQPYLQIKLKEHEEHEKKWRLHEEEMFFLQKNQELKDQLSKIKSLKLELIEEYDDCKTLINDIKNTQGKKLDLNKIEIKLNEQKRMIEVNSRFLNNEPVISDLDLLKDLNTKFQKHQKIITNLLIELTTLNNLKQSQTNVLSELDKDGNGEVDVIEGNDFNLLLKKHQKSIVEIDRTYVQQFVKISGYLKTKEKNIQSIFNLIKDTPNQDLLNEYVEVLKDDIHSYNLILFNSLNMIVSLVEDDMITFYEIHEMFDTLNMFDSKHEKDVSQKLTNIGDGLENLMYEIRDMGNKISNSIDELSYVTEQSNEQLSNQLSEIDSTMKVGNLINTINTYQNYKNNRNTKNLRG